MFDEPVIANAVASTLRVLTAIDLDNKPFFSADKVDDIRADRLLTHKFETAQRP